MVKDLTHLREYTLENKTSEIVAIRYYLVNFVEKLQPGDTITLTPRSSEELAYYMKIQEELDGNGVSKELEPIDYAKIIYRADNVISCELYREYEGRIDYKVTLNIGGNERTVNMSIYDPEEIVDYLDEGTPGPYTASSKYGSTVTFVNKQGVIIGYQQPQD